MKKLSELSQAGQVFFESMYGTRILGFFAGTEAGRYEAYRVFPGCVVEIVGGKYQGCGEDEYYHVACKKIEHINPIPAAILIEEDPFGIEHITPIN